MNGAPAPANPAAAGVAAVKAVAAGAPVLVHDFVEWRDAARALLARGVAPETVTWAGQGGAGDLLTGAMAATPVQQTAPGQTPAPVQQTSPGNAPAAPQSPAADAGAGAGAGAGADADAGAGADTRADVITDVITDVVTADAATDAPAVPAASASAAPTAARPRVSIPRSLMDMLQNAACCRQDDRWAFLYRVVWRWTHGEHDVQSAADVDGARLHQMVKAVRREEHDMHAYIRFRERPEEAGAPRFVAWFEPAHDVLPQVAEHFVSRMGKVTWLIATPDASVMWDGATLHNTGPLVNSAADLVDSGEALWLTYYRSIFNPARLNAQLMQSHIPSRFWKHLPEGAVVPEMVSNAAMGARRTGQMEAVGSRRGTTIPIAPADAQPERAQPSNLDECRRCELWQHATQAVAGVGPAQARIMIVGEQPGDQEDLQGKPFIGPAGQLLERVFGEAGVERRTIYLTNAVKHFKWEPRGKRRLHKTPAQKEIEACNYWYQKELASVQPDVIVALGSTALKAVLGTNHATLKDTLGKPIRHQGKWVVTVYHPSYVLRVPDQATKDQAFKIMVEGLRMAQSLLDRVDGADAAPTAEVAPELPGLSRP